MLALLMSSCGMSMINETVSSPIAKIRWSGPFSLERPKLTGGAQPHGLIYAGRTASGGQQQLTGLTNDTTLQGDNFLLLTAYGSLKSAPRAYDLREVKSQLGGIPFPFESLTDETLRRGEDSFGVYFFKEFRSGGAANCVLAFRRLGLDTRVLPDGTALMEVVLRNCTNGSPEEALDPIRPKNLALAGVRAPDGKRDRPRAKGPRPAPAP